MRAAVGLSEDLADDADLGATDKVQLCVARALLADPDVIALDTATMPRGAWMRPVVAALRAWHGGGLDAVCGAHVSGPRHAASRPPRTLVLTGHPRDDLHLPAEWECHLLEIVSRTEVVVSEVETRTFNL